MTTTIPGRCRWRTTTTAMGRIGAAAAGRCPPTSTMSPRTATTEDFVADLSRTDAIDTAPTPIVSENDAAAHATPVARWRWGCPSRRRRRRPPRCGGRSRRRRPCRSRCRARGVTVRRVRRPRLRTGKRRRRRRRTVARRTRDASSRRETSVGAVGADRRRGRVHAETEPDSGPPSGRHAAIHFEEPTVLETSLRLATEDPFNAPNGYPIKADTKSGLYWTPDSGDYNRARAEIWFASEEFALTNGFAKG